MLWNVTEIWWCCCFCCHYATNKQKKNHTHTSLYICADTLTKTQNLLWVPIASYSMSVVSSTKSTSEVQNSCGTEYKCLTTHRQQYTPANRHNTQGFGTPMLVLLLSIFQHRIRAGYRTGQTHSCLRWPPPLEEVQVVWQTQWSAVTFSQHQAVSS